MRPDFPHHLCSMSHSIPDVTDLNKVIPVIYLFQRVSVDCFLLFPPSTFFFFSLQLLKRSIPILCYKYMGIFLHVLQKICLQHTDTQPDYYEILIINH